MKPLAIVHTESSLGWGGQEIRILAESQGLARRGHRLTVLCAPQSRILAEAPRHLNPGGGLLCEIGRGRDILEDDYPELEFFWLDTAESEGEVFWLTADKFGR